MNNGERGWTATQCRLWIAAVHDKIFVDKSPDGATARQIFHEMMQAAAGLP